MSIITVSRGAYHRGKEVAEKAAQRLGYECIGREVLLEACKEFNIPEVKLERAIHDAPSLLDRFSHGREKYVAYFQAALLKHVQKDNVVYHGLAGQFFLKGVSHVLKVRIIADLEDRVRMEMERSGTSRAVALRLLNKDDEERRRWSLHMYGIDVMDPNLYDLVIHIRKLTVEEAVDMVCHTAGFERFRATPASQKILDESTLAAMAKAALIDLKPDIDVAVQNGVACLRVRSATAADEANMARIAKGVPGIQVVRIEPQEIERYGR